MIFLYETSWEDFEPLSLLRPVSEIRCGVLTFREKIEQVFKTRVQVIVREELLDLLPGHWPEVSRGANQISEGRHTYIAMGSLFTEPIPVLDKDEILVDANDQVLGFSAEGFAGYTTPGDIEEFLDNVSLTKHQVPGRRIKHPWEIFAGLELEVTREFKGAVNAGTVDPHVVVYGDALRVEEGACVEAGVVIDCRKGPVTVSRNSVLKGPTLIEGPCYIGPDSLVDSARLRAGTVIGPVCRVGGEVETSIFHGYVNKHHSGFIGHAYLGEWVNLGAMSANSDLKNNYSEVKVILGGETYSTGLTKFGCIIGDHTKTAIGTLIPTGAIIGIFANVLGGGLCSKSVLSFSWGEAEVYQLSQLGQTARRVMERRGVELSPEFLAYVSSLHQEFTIEEE